MWLLKNILIVFTQFIFSQILFLFIITFLLLFFLSEHDDEVFSYFRDIYVTSIQIFVEGENADVKLVLLCFRYRGRIQGAKNSLFELFHEFLC